MPRDEDHDLDECIGNIAFLLSRAGYFLATAESCTGGLIAAACTDASGSSGWFKGGIVAYADEMKRTLLHVPERDIREHGAVSEAVVKHMALNALTVCGAQAAIAVSGVAGPTGGTPGKPVGTVWIAIALTEREGVCFLDLDGMPRRLPGCTAARSGGRAAVLHAMLHHFTGNRAAVRGQTRERALRDLLILLEETMVG